jgi:uncharacterized protein (TIGR02246 family)
MKDKAATSKVMTRMTRPTDLPWAFESARSAHDMEAFGALFHHDATFVNRFATYTRGVDNIVALRRGSHETIHRDSTLENELIAVDQIAAGAAIVHFWSRLAAGVSASCRSAPRGHARPCSSHRA